MSRGEGGTGKELVARALF
ncbi:hypothetical protein [Rubripirellula reticaptiva]|nr:hypothetical protein [Rubripirellula reticaptiva]